jgi:hypothetical protein
MDPGKVSAWQLDSARRSMQLTFVDWSNRPVNLWEVAQTITALTQGQASLNLNTYDLFVTEAATRTTNGGVNNDLIISPISRSEYLALPNKAQQGGRPTQYYLQRTITPVLYLWPTPQDATVSLIVNTMHLHARRRQPQQYDLCAATLVRSADYGCRLSLGAEVCA